MENKFNNREFEQFVKQNADQYRMFPSEKVWKGIHHSLHTRRRWYGLGLILLLLTSASVTWVMLSSPGKNQPIADMTPAALSAPTAQPLTEKTNPKSVSIVPASPAVDRGTVVVSAKSQTELFSGEFVTSTAYYTTPAGKENEKPQPLSSVASSETALPGTAALPLPVARTAVEQPAIAPVAEKRITLDQTIVGAVKETANKPPITEENQTVPVTLSEKKTNSVEPDKKGLMAGVSPKSIGRKKMSWQVYITPTISYRKLRENSDFISSARAGAVTPGNYIMLTDVNSVVTHKPDIGLQLGISAGYPVSRNLRLLAGLQFNVSKYNIKAYKHSFEVATIALDNGYYSSSVSTYTNYRNFGGNSTDWLHNLYISASAPLGMEWTISNKGKTQFGVSGTLQPSYILGERAYLLSTDYKNYAEVPSLTRRWNMNTSFEAFAGYKTGKISWRIGPQVRYQLMSSFKEKYPVKEHLFDFGLKMGVQITK